MAMPGLDGGVAKQRLQHQRDQHRAAIKTHAEDGHHEDTGGVASVLEDSQIHHRMVDPQFVEHEGGKAHHGQQGQRRDPVGPEPVLLLAFVEHHLQGSNAHRQHADAPVVHALRGSADVVRVEDKKPGHNDGRHTDRDVDVEDPAPTVAVRQPAAQDRTEHGSDHDAETPKAHGLATVPGREGFQKHGLRNRLKPAAARSLNHSEENQEGQAWGEPAEERRGR